MRNLTAFDHYALTRELENLIGDRLQKVSRLPQGYKLKFRRTTLLFLLPDKLYRTSYSIPASEPDNLSLKIRKELSGRRLLSIYTLNLDRIIRMDFDDGYSLIFELFRDGNLLLLKDELILDVLHPGRWRHRVLQPRVMYNTPPSPPVARKEIITDSTLLRDLIRSGIPKPYAYELIHRLGAEETTLTTSVDKQTILSALSSLLSDLSSPSGYFCEGEPYPIRLSYLPCEESYSTFSEALDSFTPSLFFTEEKEKQKPSKLEYMLKSLDELNEEISSLEALINEVYTNWSELESMLRTKNFRSTGKLRFKGVEGKEAVFDFTP